jgi:hypothetical protein
MVAGLVAFVLLLVVLPACSDDPVLGPSDGSEESGGSYSSINSLAPPSAADSTQQRSPSGKDSAAVNPERF